MCLLYARKCNTILKTIIPALILYHVFQTHAFDTNCQFTVRLSYFVHNSQATKQFLFKMLGRYGFKVPNYFKIHGGGGNRETVITITNKTISDEMCE